MIIGRYDFLFRCHGCRTAVEHGGLAHASGGRAFESRFVFFLVFFLFFTSGAAFLIRSLKEVHLYLCVVKAIKSEFLTVLPGAKRFKKLLRFN